MATASITLEESFEAPMSRDALWRLMSDPETVVSFIPGAELTGRRDDGEYEGVVTQKLGPTSVRFSGTVGVEFDEDACAGSIRARGGDRKGRTRATATTTFHLDERSRGTVDAPITGVQLSAVIEMTGALSAFLSSGGVHLARRVLEQFATNVADHAAGVAPTNGDES